MGRAVAGRVRGGSHGVDVAGVAWVLGAVFVRFCEANDLIHGRWIADDAMHHAVDAETAFYAADPARNSRDWLRDEFVHLAQYPAARGLVDPDHSPVWTAPLSEYACGAILAFWRTQNADGTPAWPLTDPTCGSGYFLLGAFERLLEAWSHKAPAMDTRERVQCVLTSINGVDINTLRGGHRQVPVDARSDARLWGSTAGRGTGVQGAGGGGRFADRR